MIKLSAAYRRIGFDEDFDHVYAVFFPKLVRFANTYLRDFEESENAVQDIFMRLWEHREAIPYSGNITAYLFTITKNKCIDLLRQHRSRLESLSDVEQREIALNLYSLQEFDANNFTLREIEQIIEDAIATLPPRCRQIFIMSRMEGMSHREISEKLSVSKNTIEGQMTIALRRLHAALKNYLPLYIFLMV